VGDNDAGLTLTMRDNIIAYVWCINVMSVGVYFEGIEHTMTKCPIRYWSLVALRVMLFGYLPIII